MLAVWLNLFLLPSVYLSRLDLNTAAASGGSGSRGSGGGGGGADYRVDMICGEPGTLGKMCSASHQCKENKATGEASCVLVARKKTTTPEPDDDDDDEEADDDEGVLLLGGTGTTAAQLQAETFPCIRRATTMVPFVWPKVHSAAARLGPHVYLCGGISSSSPTVVAATAAAAIVPSCAVLVKGQWLPGPPLVSERAKFSLTEVANTLIAIGGVEIFTAAAAVGNQLSPVQLLDLANNVWRPVPDWNIAFRHSHCTVAVSPTEVVIIGGVGSDLKTPIAQVEAVKVTTGIVRMLPPLLMPRFGHACALFGKSDILITGGKNGNNEILATVEAFNIFTMTYKVLPPLQVPRFYHSCGIVQGRPVVFGGEGSLISQTTGEALHKEAADGRWQWAMLQLKVARAAHAMAVIHCS